MTDHGHTIQQALTERDMQDVKFLFQTYHDALGVDISYQNFAKELDSLPGQYARPAGALLLARDASGRPVGCVCLRPMNVQGRCELKRLYVIGSVRGTGLGKLLAEAAVGEARALGYTTIMLDSLRTMAQAIKLYEALGFQETEAYYETPLDTRFFKKNLA